jgi:hypothetical protein
MRVHLKVRLRLFAEDVHFVLVEAFVTATIRYRHVKWDPALANQYGFASFSVTFLYFTHQKCSSHGYIFTKNKIRCPRKVGTAFLSLISRSTGLWRWYITITVTILDIIQRPVFYLKLNSTLEVCPYLTGNTLRLRYEPNRLMLSTGLWRWYTNITITVLDIIYRPVFYLKHDISETGMWFRLQVEPT